MCGVTYIIMAHSLAFCGALSDSSNLPLRSWGMAGAGIIHPNYDDPRPNVVMLEGASCR